MTEALVVGSGPSGIAAAYALLKKGVAVTLLDAGRELEPHLQALVDRKPWDEGEFLSQVYRQRKEVLQKGKTVLLKMPFGSDYAYSEEPETALRLAPTVKLVTSLAKGGLSTAWGSNLSAFSRKDMREWPIQPEDLDPYYRQVSEFLDYTAHEDAVDLLYTTKLASAHHYPLSSQGKYVHDRIEKNRGTLLAHGVYAGRAKLAIGRKYSDQGQGCVLCGQCMHGCVFGAIFNSAYVLRDLLREKNFTYRPGYLVKGFTEKPDEVVVEARNLHTGATETFPTKRLFLGLGVIGSTALVARTLGLTDQVFTIQDNQKYLFPFLTRDRIPGATAEKSNTLAQIFVQVPEMPETPNTVHGQLYGYNDLILSPLRKVLGGGADWAVKGGKLFFERLMIGMAYLHADDSGPLRLKVDTTGTRLGDVSGESSAQGDRVFKAFTRVLRANRDALGGAPMPLIAQRNPPGESQHFGGSLPMRQSPGRTETDILGRPHGSRRVHLVDSSVFTKVPAVPTAFSLMANAARIANQAELG